MIYVLENKKTRLALFSMSGYNNLLSTRTLRFMGSVRTNGRVDVVYGWAAGHIGQPFIFYMNIGPAKGFIAKLIDGGIRPRMAGWSTNDCCGERSPSIKMRDGWSVWSFRHCRNWFMAIRLVKNLIYKSITRSHMQTVCCCRFFRAIQSPGIWR